MTYTPGVSLAMSSQSRVNYFNSGTYIPGRLPGGALDTGLSPANAHPGQIGQEITHPIAGVLGYGVIYDLWQTFGTLDTGTGSTVADGGPTLPWVGGTSYAAIPSGSSAQALLAMEGWNDIVSGIVVDTVQLNELAAGDTPFPSVYAGNVATFDGTTLTLPLSSVISFMDGTTTYTITTAGTLVAVVVPEPSTMILFGFSVVGLLSYAWRARKRRAA
jgi:hypothetical protein